MSSSLIVSPRSLLIFLGLSYIFTTRVLRINASDYALGMVSLAWEVGFLTLLLNMAKNRKWLWPVTLVLVLVMAFFWAASVEYFIYFGSLPGKFAIEYLYREFNDAISTSRDGAAIRGGIVFFLSLSLWRARRGNGFTGQDFVSIAEVSSHGFKSFRWENNTLTVAHLPLDAKGAKFNWEKTDCAPLRKYTVFERLPCRD